MLLTDTDRLTDLVARKHDCLRQLHALAVRQSELIEADAMSDLMHVLAAKQRLLGALQGWERELDPFRRQQPDERRWRSEALRMGTGKLLDECEGLLAEILREEKQGEERLRRRRDETAVRLRDVQDASRACGAYTERPAAAPRRLDLSAED